MTDGRGGKRPGAGRPRKAEKYAGQIAAAEDRIADRLPAIIDDLLNLAHGGWEQVSEEWRPSALVTVGSGEFDTPAFPNLPADHPVLVKTTKAIAAPDRAALIYLTDRILGRPTAEGDNDRAALLALILGHLDLSKLSDEQLDRLESGEDPLSVLFGG